MLALFRAMVFNCLYDPRPKLDVMRWFDTGALPIEFFLHKDLSLVFYDPTLMNAAGTP